ncbi:hypothetical protein AB0953_31205 [Streptomyces sp. NPDC046866]|uniref:hypothetical protein n=1 Tax=Streptomyces sp. NPDC046866 TaxID=3154921 RepID=UPI003452ADE6
MLNLEERITRVWHQEVRPLVVDAYRCHSTGTPRAAIVATWTAVCADIIHKLYQLAEDGDGTAAEVVKRIEGARSKADDEAVKTMQQVERNLLQNALDLELIDFIEHRQLERLKQDRHLCAHPSLRPLGDVFAPSGEYARAHLVAALDALLVHPPTQGRKACARYTAHVSDPSFVGHGDYLVQMFAQRVKSSAWKQILGIAAKHAMLELEVPEGIGITASVAADRHALCLIAFAQHDRDAVREAVTKAMSTFNGLPIEQQLKTIARLGAFDVFVDALDETVCQQIGTYVDRRPAVVTTSSGAVVASSTLALIGLDAVRDRIPALGSKFAKLSPYNQAAVIERQPSAYFTDFLAPILASAGGWRIAEYLTKIAVIPCARLVQPEQLDGILTAWANNEQCREASGMPELAVTFWTQATQLQSHQAWAAFVKRVRELASDPQWFQYEQLAAVISYKDGTSAL